MVSLPSLATCKSESLGQLIVSNMAAVNGGNRTNNTEKKSLASKLSGTLNRNNSGEYSSSLQILTKFLRDSKHKMLLHCSYCLNLTESALCQPRE